MNPFNELYNREVDWCPGSTASYCADFAGWLQRFIGANRIRSVVDYGCGYFRWQSLVDWPRYTGVDCVQKVIDHNKELDTGFEFQYIEPGHWTPPIADLLLVKDVFQHWENDRVQHFLKLIGKPVWLPYVLLINDFAPENADIEYGGYRPLDLFSAPFYLRGAYVYWFGRVPDNKVAFLVRN